MDMQDRELLEMAAKAAIYVIRWYEDTISYGPIYGIEVEPGNPCGFEPWNPLADDGDALRLAVKLQLSICNEHVSCGAAYCTDLSEMTFPSVDSGSSESFVIDADYAATRRAIVLAAAQIGRAMP